MKRGLLILLLVLVCLLHSFGQNNVFVLVDVSGSRGADPIKVDAKRFVLDFVMGAYNPNGWTPNNITEKAFSDIIAGKNTPLVSQGSWYCIMPFGNLNTYKGNHIEQCKIGPDDFKNGYQRHYPSRFTDGYTYIQIAEAYTISLAKTYRLNEYYVFVITDNLGDQDDTNSKNSYDDFEEKLLLEWGNSSSSIVHNIGSFTKSKYYINLKKVVNVQQSKMPTNPKITPPPIIVGPTDSNAVIKIASPSGGKKNKEVELSSDQLVVNWSCKNCPAGGKFVVSVTEYEGGKFREVKKDLQSNSCSITLPDGTFKISVSGQNFVAQGDTTFVSVSTGGAGWIIWLLVILVAAGIGYWFWNKRRKETLDDTSNIPKDDLFSRNSSTRSTEDTGYW